MDPKLLHFGRAPAAIIIAGLVVGTISSLLGVAGGEFIIPMLIFAFGIPVVVTEVARHWLTGHYRSQSMLIYLVLPMCIGSFAGAMIGGYLAAWAAAILELSAVKLWSREHA
jgi:uncharacterized protein